jgi:D-glycero-D-manno-heptose 1,7-bisphosphate phosphatase
VKDKYIVLDRDGTLIKYVPYLYLPEKVELHKETKRALKLLIKNNCKLFLHTNQSGVARGYFENEDVIKCNDRLIQLLGLGDSVFEMICVASDYPPTENSYRKPSPLFGFDLMKKYKIEANQIYYVGDSISDLTTAKNIGCKAYGLENGGFDLKNDIKDIKELQYKICSDIYHAAKEIIKEC